MGRFTTFALLSIQFAFSRGDSSLLNAASADKALFTPVKISVEDPGTSHTQTLSAQFTLSKVGQIANLDYGYEVAGYPYFNVESINHPVQIEVKYSESFHALAFPLADGPYPYANGLTNTFRVETFNVTKTGVIESYFIQGGQRWQSVKLLTPGHIVFKRVGLRPTISTTSADDLPAGFFCSNDDYNEIWRLGARAATAACIAAEHQPATWEITADGALIHGQKPGYSAIAANEGFANYTLQFETKIVRGGAGWSVAGNVQLLLMSNLPAATTFVNTNKTLTPPNSLVLARGYSFVNQTTLTSFYLGSTELPMTIEENQWYKIKTSLTGANLLQVWIDDKEVYNQTLPKWVSGSVAGSFGFGPYQDQTALYRNVVVRDVNGKKIYNNALTHKKVLGEYGTGKGNTPVCLDGAKRDREVWLGDFFHTARIIGISTSQFELVSGTLQFCLDRQTHNGILPINGIMGRPPYFLNLNATTTGLSDYQILGLLAFVTYYQDTKDLDWARQYWPKWKLQIEWLRGNIDLSTGLVKFSGFLGPANGTAVSGAMAQALNGAAIIARDIGDTPSASMYKSLAATILNGINTYLWNDDMGVYRTAVGADDFSVAGISFAITSGAADEQRTARSLERLSDLELVIGYKDTFSTNASSPATKLSPNTNGFLLSALGQSKTYAPAKYLLDNLWTAMIRPDRLSSGASWEYVFPNGEPGLSLFTSESHPWGGAATYFLTYYVAGIRAVTAGYKNFVIDPAYSAFDLDWAQAHVVTPGGTLSANWNVSGNQVTVKVSTPKGTSGSLITPAGKTVVLSSGQSEHTFKLT